MGKSSVPAQACGANAPREQWVGFQWKRGKDHISPVQQRIVEQIERRFRGVGAAPTLILDARGKQRGREWLRFLRGSDEQRDVTSWR